MFVRLGRFRFRFKQAMLRFRSIRNWKCYNCSDVDIYVIQNCVICVYIQPVWYRLEFSKVKFVLCVYSSWLFDVVGYMISAYHFQ